MGRRRSQADTQDSTDGTAVAAGHASSESSTAAEMTPHRRRQFLRNRLRSLRCLPGRTKSSIANQLQHHMRAAQNDKLCLDVFNELLPQQFMDELRDQVHSGAEPLAAVEHTAKKRLGKLADSDVQKLFLALAVASSASCGIVHVSKRLVCALAKPLRLGRPMGFVTDVLMPTSLYGPLLAAYIAVAAAKGAIRQITAEGKGGKGSEGGGKDRQQQQQLLDGQQQQQGMDLSSASHVAQYEPAAAADKDVSGHNNTGSSSSSTSQARNHHQQQQQQDGKKRGRPWWVIWQHKQQQHQQQRRSASDVKAATHTPDDTAAAATAANKEPGASISSNAEGFASAGSGSSSSSSRHRNELDQVSLRKVAEDHSSAGAACPAAATAAGPSTMLPAAADGGFDPPAAPATASQQQQQPSEAFTQQMLEHHSNTEDLPTSLRDLPTDAAAAAAAAAIPEQQQQQQPHSEGSTMPLLKHPSSPQQTPRTSDSTSDRSDHENLGDHLPHTPARSSSTGKSNLPPSPLPRSLTTPTYSSDLSDLAHARSASTELDSQVDKLQRRWSSGDHSGLVDEALGGNPLLSQPFRPPVFSRLASGRAACRITAAAAAKEEAADHLHVQGSAGSGSSKGLAGLGLGFSRSGSMGLPPSPGVLRGTVSLDLGSDVTNLGLASSMPNPLGHHGGGGGLADLAKAHSDNLHMHQPLGPLAAAAAGSDDGSSSTAANLQQQQLQKGSVEARRQGFMRTKLRQSLDWGHKLMSAEQ